MTDAVFRADSFAALDPHVLDDVVLGVLGGFFRSAWSTEPTPASEPPFDLDEDLCVFSVRVSGITEQEITVRLPQSTCGQVVHLVGLTGQASCQDVVAELVNTLAGRLKVSLADGLSTGIPLHLPSPQLGAVQLLEAGYSGVPSYRGVFTCGSLRIEVLAGA